MRVTNEGIAYSFQGQVHLLSKLSTSNDAVAKTERCFKLTFGRLHSCNPVTEKDWANHIQLIDLLVQFVEEQFESFQLPTEIQRVLAEYEFLAYFIASDEHDCRKVGISYTKGYKRVRTQINTTDTSKVICLMTPDQIMSQIPQWQWLIDEIIRMQLPGLQFHPSHGEMLRKMIATFLAELLFRVCTNSPNGIVCERFFQVLAKEHHTIFERSDRLCYLCHKVFFQIEDFGKDGKKKVQEKLSALKDTIKHTTENSRGDLVRYQCTKRCILAKAAEDSRCSKIFPPLPANATPISAFDPSKTDHLLNPLGVAILGTARSVLFLQSWQTHRCDLRQLVAENPDSFLKHLVGGLDRLHGYPTKFISHWVYGDSFIKKFINAMDESPTSKLGREIARNMLLIKGDTAWEDLSNDQVKQIAKQVQRIAHTEEKNFDAYIAPAPKDLGEAASDKFDSINILGDSDWDQLSLEQALLIQEQVQRIVHSEDERFVRPAEVAAAAALVIRDDSEPGEPKFRVSNDFGAKVLDILKEFAVLVTEHTLIEALIANQSDWVEENLILDPNRDMGHDMYFCTHKKKGYKMLVNRSFFILVAELIKNQQRITNMGHLVHLFKYILHAGRMSEEDFDERCRLLKSFAMRLQLEDDGQPDQSYREARTRFFPRDYFQSLHKGTQVVFGNIGEHGISNPAGLILAQILTLPEFEKMLNAVYRMEIPTPLNPEFVCRGVSGNGCGHVPNGSQNSIVCAGSKIPGYPKRLIHWMCSHCRSSSAFDDDLRNILRHMDGLTKVQQELLDTLEARYERDKAQKRKWHHDTKDTAEQITRRRRNQADRNSIPEVRDANRFRQIQRDAQRVRNGEVSKSNIQKYSMCKGAKYPWALMEKLCKGLLLFLRKFGTRKVETEKVYDLLRAVLIQYHLENPDEEVIEFYAAEVKPNGEAWNRPIYLRLEFQKVADYYTTQTDRDGNILPKGKARWSKFDMFSDEQIETADQERANPDNNISRDDQLIPVIVSQAFDDDIEFDPPVGAAWNRNQAGVLLRDTPRFTTTRTWTQMGDDIELSYN